MTAEAVGTSRNSSASLRKALGLLSVIADQQPGGAGLSLTEVATAAGLNKSTALRLTAPLLEENLLSRDAETGRFRLGHACLGLGQSYLAGIDLRTVARPGLRQLLKQTRATVHLVVLNGSDVVYLDKVENEAVVRMASRVGATMPAYCTAVGKAILSFSSPSVVDEILEGPLTPLTERTVTEPDELRRQFAAIRRAGYAVDDRENEPEVRCVAAPILGVADEAVGAISVSTLTSQMPLHRVREVGAAVAAECARISVSMGSPWARRHVGDAATRAGVAVGLTAS